MKNIKILRASPKCHIVHTVLKNRAACHGTIINNLHFEVCTMGINYSVLPKPTIGNLPKFLKLATTRSIKLFKTPKKF
jgi:hypothetical protein